MQGTFDSYISASERLSLAASYSTPTTSPSVNLDQDETAFKMRMFSVQVVCCLSTILFAVSVLTMENIGLEDRSPSFPRLPSDEEFSEALLGAHSPSSNAVADAPWGWVKFPGPSIPRGEYRVHPFTTPDGRTWGPFRIGGTQFQSKPYPLDTPFFRLTNHYGQLYPVDFEHYIAGEVFLIDNSIFRPNPEMLRRIRVRVVAPLRATGWQPGSIPGSNDEDWINEGEFLWPPVRTHPDIRNRELQMTANVRSKLHAEAMAALSQHTMESPSVWTLTLPGVEGERERKIMMTRISPRYADSPWLAGRSDLWVFHEALVDVMKGQRTTLGLLGGMFLPKGAAETLRREGYVRPAFAELFGRAH